MCRSVYRALLGICLGVLVTTVHGQVQPLRNGYPYLPDEILLAQRVVSWSYVVEPSPDPLPLSMRTPSISEQRVIAQARSVLAANEAKAIALLDGPNVVYVEYKAPAAEQSWFYAASAAKTLTSMAVGQAICAGKLKIDDRAADWLPELKGKALGNATVRDLLRMASGAVEPDNPGNPISGNILTPQDYKDWASGRLNFIEVLSRDSVAGAAHGVFSDYKPGEKFVYKATDPLVLGIMVSRATGMPFNRWVQKRVFDPMGLVGPGRIAQDKQQNAMADGGVRLRMDDWIRFAWWVKQASKADGCFGDYVRQATRTRIANGTTPQTRKSGGSFAGYGYLVWTEHRDAPDTYWALGYGGQRIGWNYNNDRMVVSFSNHENWMPALTEVYRDWIRAGK